MNTTQRKLLRKIKSLERKIFIAKLKRIVQKFLPVSQKQHNKILEQAKAELRIKHNRELQEAVKAIDELMPKLVRLSLEYDANYPYGRTHRLQIFLHEGMMNELNYSDKKEYIARAIGMMVEHEIFRLHYVFPTRY